MNKILLMCLFTLLTLCASLGGQNIISEEIILGDSDTLVLKTNKRAFYANKLIDAHINYPYVTGQEPESVGEGLYRVLNMLPAEFNNLEVYAKLTGIEDTILVDRFSLVKAYTSTMVELPFVTGDQDFETKQGGLITITDSKSKFESLWPECADTLFEQVRSIKQTTYYQFAQFTGSNWSELTPQIARHFTASLANVMYMWSHPVIDELIANYSGTLYNNTARFVCLYQGDSTVAQGDSLIKVDTWSSSNKKIQLSDEIIVYDTLLYGHFDTYTKVEKLMMKGTTDSLISIYPKAKSVDKFYTISKCIDPKTQLLDKIYNHTKISFCPTGPVNGLGGGSTFGLRYLHFYYSMYEKGIATWTPFKGNAGGMSTFAHEWAHCVGFSHSSNTTYGDVAGSWVDISSLVFNAMSTDNDIIPGVMYKDNQDRVITSSLPFLFNIYIQEIEYTDSIGLGSADVEMNTATSIQIKHKNYNVEADLVIDEIICPEWMSYDGGYPIVIAPKGTVTIPLTVAIQNTSDTVAIYNDVIVVKGKNTLEIPVTASVNPDVATGIEKDDDEISVYPNPTQGTVTISSDYDYVEVYDLSGKSVHTQSYHSSSIDLSALPHGIYLMNIVKADKAYMERIVIE